MSTIKNPNVTKGSVVTHTDLNQKFSDITTATTGGLDGLNVRSEAIDVNNLNTTPASGHSSITTLILKDTGTHDNGSRPSVDPGGAVALTTYNSTLAPGPSPVPISHGSGGGELIKTFVVETGQMLRVHWQVWVEDYPEHGGETWGPGAASGHNIGFTPPVYPCWPIWLQWRQSGAWSEVAGQTDFADTIPLSPAFKGGPTNETAATMLIPHGCLYYANGLSGGTYTNSAMWHREHGRMYRASWNYVNTGADLTIEGFRLVIDGVYHPATSGGQAQIVHENGGLGDGWSASVTDNQIRLATVNIAVLLMEKD